MIRWPMLLALACAVPVGAQPVTKLALTGFNGNMGTAVLADFDQGFRDSPTSTTYTVTITARNRIRTTTAYIRANAATMGGGKSVSDCQWRRNDLGTWNALTTTDALVESKVIQNVGTSWNNSIWFRCNLNWATDTPLTYSVPVTITLQVTP
ncbi:MAG TPA: hypothetical protein VHE78_08395 [Gemmatimonadaceae bacterium]|nr:hypothetical protein [Gemmatimonadaceae bacterium]